MAEITYAVCAKYTDGTINVDNYGNREHANEAFAVESYRNDLVSLEIIAYYVADRIDISYPEDDQVK